MCVCVCVCVCKRVCVHPLWRRTRADPRAGPSGRGRPEQTPCTAATGKIIAIIIIILLLLLLLLLLSLLLFVSSPPFYTSFFIVKGSRGRRRSL